MTGDKQVCSRERTKPLLKHTLNIF